MTSALAAEGFQVARADDGRKGLERALAYRFDLILLKLFLSDVDSLYVLTNAPLERPDVPVILLSRDPTCERRSVGSSSERPTSSSNPSRWMSWRHASVSTFGSIGRNGTDPE